MTPAARTEANVHECSGSVAVATRQSARVCVGAPLMAVPKTVQPPGSVGGMLVSSEMTAIITSPGWVPAGAARSSWVPAPAVAAVVAARNWMAVGDIVHAYRTPPGTAASAGGGTLDGCSVVALRMNADSVSVTTRFVIVAGPVFVTTIRYVTAAPGAGLAGVCCRSTASAAAASHGS